MAKKINRKRQSNKAAGAGRPITKSKTRSEPTEDSIPESVQDSCSTQHE